MLSECFASDVMRYLIVAMFSGLLYSLSTIFSKIIVSEMPVLSVLTNPLFLFINIIFGGGGFILSQVSMKKIKASHAFLVSTSAATSVIVLASFFVLKEIIVISELVGVFLMLTGSLILLVRVNRSL